MPTREIPFGLLVCWAIAIAMLTTLTTTTTAVTTAFLGYSGLLAPSLWVLATGFVGCVSGILYFYRPTPFSFRPVDFFVAVFIILYSIRIYHDSVMIGFTSQGAFEYFSRLYVMAVLPYIFIRLAMQPALLAPTYLGIGAALTLSNASAVFFLWGTLQMTAGRLGDDLLFTPLTISYNGMIGVAIGLVMAFFPPRPKVPFLLFGWVVAAGGALPLVMGGSRGAAVILAFALLLILYRLVRVSVVRTLAFALLGPTVLFIILTTFGSSLLDLVLMRLKSIQDDIYYQRPDAYRVLLWKDSFSQFLDSPVFGSALEEKNLQFYPHNLILEAFMSTGIVGGIPFLAVIGLAGYAAFKNLLGPPLNFGVTLFFVMMFLSSMVSFSIWNHHMFWVSLAMNISVGLFPKATGANAAGPVRMRAPMVPQA